MSIIISEYLTLCLCILSQHTGPALHDGGIPRTSCSGRGGWHLQPAGVQQECSADQTLLSEPDHTGRGEKKKKKDETQTESEGRTSVRFLSGRVEGSEGQKERDRRRERQRGGGRGERGPKKSWVGVKEWVERSLKEAEGNWQRVRLRENKWNMS